MLAAGAIHPDLVNRLAYEAAKAAHHVLNMCIRALDYCPPVEITFGDYLRALITEDAELVPEDERGYYLYPEGYGQPKEKGIEYAHRPPELTPPAVPTDSSATLAQAQR